MSPQTCLESVSVERFFPCSGVSVCPTCRDAGALLRAQAGHGQAAGRSSSAGLDVQLSVVVAVISYSGATADWLDACGRGSTGGRV